MQTLFGCGSPRTVVADTSCEIVVLQRADIDDTLESFPVLQEQMEMFESDESYREKLLTAISRRKHCSRIGYVAKFYHDQMIILILIHIEL